MWKVAPPTEVETDPKRSEAYQCGAIRLRALAILRRERKHTHAALDDVPVAAPDHAARDELAARVHTVLARMRAEGGASAADLLEWRWLDRLKVAAIAKRLGKSAKVVSARLQRAKTKFRAAWLACGGGIVANKTVERFRQICASDFGASGNWMLSPTSPGGSPCGGNSWAQCSCSGCSSA